MGGDRESTWVEGRIADAWPRPGRPLALLIAAAALILAIDALLGLALGPRDAPLGPASEADAAAILEAAAAAAPESWLLIGDSVLAGDVMEGRVDGWEAQRVIDYLGREAAPEGAPAFAQIALDGLLPTDIERIVDELDRRDPEARVGVVIELNLRYFSPHHADEAGCTRPWICRLGGLDPARDDLTTIASSPLAALAAALRPWTPILRHRRALDLDRRIGGAINGAAGLAGRAPGADEVNARVAAHYRESALHGGSAQLAALDRLLARLRARGRRARFFTTPLRDAFVRELGGEEVIGGRYAALAERIHDAGGDATLFHLDHPLFADEHFLDHCHLGPEGNRLLALNLLEALDVPLARRPAWTEIIRSEGPHETLLGRLDTGYAEGAPWQALLDAPEGLAVDPKRRTIVLADTGNHVLRRLRGSLETTELLAGAPGERGASDGPAALARLDRPRELCLLGDDVYFLDGPRGRLRRLVDGEVATIPTPTPGHRLRCHADRLWVLGPGGLLVVDPGDGSVDRRPLKGPTPLPRPSALALAPDGRIFVADRQGRIHVGELPARAGAPIELRVIFANTAEEPLPRARKRKFPYTFDEVRFAGIADLVFVERYGGLLVQDVIPPTKVVRDLTENVHLRYLDLEERRVYPWIKPEVYGQSYVMLNATSDSLVSGFHQGTMALDQGSASLFYVEHHRSRLYRIDDGIFGAAKTGHFGGGTAKPAIHDRLGQGLGKRVSRRFKPHRHLGERWRRSPRRGPFLALMLGASTSAYHDHLGEYSLARRFEIELAAELAYRDRAELDLYQRLAAGTPLRKMIEMAREAQEEGPPLDLIFIEVHPLANHFLGDARDDAGYVALLGELEALREESGALVVLLDDTSIAARRRDGMRPPATELRRFLELAERAGVPVVRPGDRLLREHLDHAAWASQPWSRKRWQAHGSTWGIDLTGAMMASIAYPRVAAHLRGRSPRHRDPEADKPRDPRPLVAEALRRRPFAADALPPLAAEAVQLRYERGELRIFVDLDRVEGGDDPDALILAALHLALVDDVYGPLAREVSVELARFASFDEYGAGVLEAATIERRRRFNRSGLARFIKKELAAHPEWASARDPAER